MDQPAETKEDDLITVVGGAELEITRQDGSKETVKVRQIPLSKMQAFSMAVGFGNMSDAIDLYCDKPKGWGDTLSLESAKAVMDKGCELNLPFFGVWLKDQKRWRAAFGIAMDNGERKDEPSLSEQLPRQSPITTDLVPNR